MNEHRVECNTILVDDSPAVNDAFAVSGNLGPHDRVAKAIAELTSESGGKMIGLEGGWGIGKTTVVNLLKKHIEEDPDRQVIIFDAWAHEGDPLRRTFLESLIQQLDQIKWLGNRKEWDNTREALAKRRRISKQRTIPKPTMLGKMVALSLLFVPIGPPLLSAALKKGITLTPGAIAWNFWLGLLCIAAPVLAIILRWAWLRFSIFNKILGPSFLSISNWFIPNNLRVEPDKTNKNEETDSAENQIEEISQLSLLLSHSITEIQTQITEEPEPTSIEFEYYFCKLMNECLNDSKRNLILVLDNLDRVDPKDALAIWSTLQTFLQGNSLSNAKWFEKLWVLVPYDPSGLRNLWNNKGADPYDTTLSSRKSDESQKTGVKNLSPIVQQSFLDKSFLVRFEVPPPMLSNWRQFLCDLAQIALPNHPNEDFKLIYQVFNLFREDSRTPTPRELKLYVNQIGTLHRQWHDEFKIAHLAYYALLRRNGYNVIRGLQDGTIPNECVRYLLESNVRDELAGLSFNVNAELGRELLLGDSILSSLERRNADELKRIESINSQGFWAVLEQLATTELVNGDPHMIANSAVCLQQAGFINSHQRGELDTVIRVICDTAEQFEDWETFDSEIAHGVVELCEIKSDVNYSRKLMDSIFVTLENIAQENESNDEIYNPIELIDWVFLILNKIEDLGHSSAYGDPLFLPLTVNQWLVASDYLYKTYPRQIHWKRIEPTCKFDEISTLINSAINSESVDDQHINMICVTNKTPIKGPWKQITSTLRDQLDAGSSISTAAACFDTEMLCELVHSRFSEAENVFKDLVQNGHLLHYFYSAENAIQRSWLAFAYISQQPNVSAPSVYPGDSEKGFTELLSYLKSTEQDDVEQFSRKITHFDCPEFLFVILDERQQFDELIVECIKHFAFGNSPEKFFTYDIISNYWQSLPSILDDNSNPHFNELLKYLVDKTCLTTLIMNDQKGFVTHDAGLYQRILSLNFEKKEDFIEWVTKNIESLDEDTWLEELSSESELLDLVLFFLDSNYDLQLRTNFKDALISHGKSILDSTLKLPSRLNVDWRNLFDAIQSPGTRKDLGNRLLSALIDQSGNFPPEFLELYGDEISDIDMLLEHPRVISDLFTFIVKNREVKSLSWLFSILTKATDFLDRYEFESEVEEFVVRLKENLDQDSSDEAQIVISNIASLLNVQPTEKKELKSEESEEK